MLLVEGLIQAGESPDSTPIRNAITFLLGKQNPNGGWGESYVACVNKSFPPDGSGVCGCWYFYVICLNTVDFPLVFIV